MSAIGTKRTWLVHCTCPLLGAKRTSSCGSAVRAETKRKQGEKKPRRSGANEPGLCSARSDNCQATSTTLLITTVVATVVAGVAVASTVIATVIATAVGSPVMSARVSMVVVNLM